MKVEVTTLKTEEEKKLEKVLELLAGNVSFVQTRSEQETIVRSAVEKVYGKINDEKKKEITKEILSYGPIEQFMKDDDIEDIIVNALNPIFTFTSKGGMTETRAKFQSLEQLNLFIRKLQVISGKEKLKYINNFHLPEGARANVVASPLGTQVTIRKFRRKPLSLIDLIQDGSMDYDTAALFWMYADGLRIKPANIMIVGTPGSGKTTLLNALFSFFPKNERTIVIEDTLELNTETALNCARLETSEELPLRELVKNTLRMRPSRIVVGEVRGEEANDLMTAMNIGKICMGTIHASSAREAVMRLENVPMNVPPDLIPLVDAFIVLKQYYTPEGVKRVVHQIAETGGMEQKKVLLSDLAIYDVKEEKMKNAHPSVIYRDRLAEASGISPKEVMDEIALRAKIIQTLTKRGVRDIDEMSEFVEGYYENPKNAMSKIGL